MRHSLIILLLGLNKPRMYICYANFLQTNIQQIYIIKYQKYLQHIKLITAINMNEVIIPEKTFHFFRDCECIIAVFLHHLHANVNSYNIQLMKQKKAIHIKKLELTFSG